MTAFEFAFQPVETTFERNSLTLIVAHGVPLVQT
jgi:hypothetical protein